MHTLQQNTTHTFSLCQSLATDVQPLQCYIPDNCKVPTQESCVKTPLFMRDKMMITPPMQTMWHMNPMENIFGVRRYGSAPQGSGSLPEEQPAMQMIAYCGSVHAKCIPDAVSHSQTSRKMYVYTYGTREPEGYMRSPIITVSTKSSGTFRNSNCFNAIKSYFTVISTCDVNSISRSFSLSHKLILQRNQLNQILMLTL